MNNHNNVILSSSNMPKKYKDLLNQIEEQTLIKIYSVFSFSYLNLKNQAKEIDLDKIFNDYSLIAFKISNFNNNSNDTNAIICVENLCYIIESIKKDIILSFLKKTKSSLVNAGDEMLEVERISDYSKSQREIQHFCDSFKRHIIKNQFVKMTICPIIAYIIRRHFYPTSFFKDPSFFSFKNKRTKTSSSILSLSTKEIQSEIEKEIKDDEINFVKFEQKDFVVLRDLNSSNATFQLVIHKESLNIFIMKRYPNNYPKKSLDNELNFYKNHSNRCLVRYYGYIEENNTVNAVICEFMSQRSLDKFLSINNDKGGISKQFSFTIFQNR